jgi:hypothetical protein
MSSLVLSCIFFGHALHPKSIGGAIVVFGTLFYIMRRKYRARGQKIAQINSPKNRRESVTGSQPGTPFQELHPK